MLVAEAVAFRAKCDTKEEATEFFRLHQLSPCIDQVAFAVYYDGLGFVIFRLECITM